MVEMKFVNDNKGNEIPVSLVDEDNGYIISIGNSKWLRTSSYAKASIVYNILLNHLGEYVTIADSI